MTGFVLLRVVLGGGDGRGDPVDDEPHRRSPSVPVKRGTESPRIDVPHSDRTVFAGRDDTGAGGVEVDGSYSTLVSSEPPNQISVWLLEYSMGFIWGTAA